MRLRQSHVTRTTNKARIVWRCDQPHDAGLLRPVYVQHFAKLDGRDAADGTEEPMQKGFARSRANGFGDERSILRTHVPEPDQLTAVEWPFGAPIGIVGTRRPGFCRVTIHRSSMAHLP